MRKLTEEDLIKIKNEKIQDYEVKDIEIKKGPYSDSDHYGIILAKNQHNHWVTWEFHLLDDDRISTYWGHYFMEDEKAAIDNFKLRIIDNGY